MGGDPKFEFTPKICNKIKKMASAGMNLDFIADAIGTTARTMQKDSEIKKIYNDAYTDIIVKIGESLLARAQEPQADSTLLIFVMKTRAKWKEDKAVKMEGFEGDMVKKLETLDQHLREGLISEETYARLTSSLVSRWKAEEHESRLLAVEQAIAANQAVVKKQANKTDNA
jgi:hypothetical protein